METVRIEYGGLTADICGDEITFWAGDESFDESRQPKGEGFTLNIEDLGDVLKIASVVAEREILVKGV